MQTLLYLDSARMGLMCERARQAYFDYIRLAGHEGCSLYFEQLLHEGFSAWPRRLQLQYPAISDWQGNEELKSSIRLLLRADASAPTLLTNRTSQLMQLAARMMAQRCQRVLVTDLAWPGYRRIIEQHRGRTGLGISTVPLRRTIFEGRATRSEVIDLIVRRYRDMNCDGLFLPAVSHEGVRLPIDDLCRAVAAVRRPAFVVVDGAQAIAHVSNQLGIPHCDLFIAGCHKWLRGHVPMGIGLLPNSRSSQQILSSADRMVMCGGLDDPLLTFTRQLETRTTELFSETVSLGSIFSSRAAIAALDGCSHTLQDKMLQRQRNVRVLSRAIEGLGWRMVSSSNFASGIVLLKASDEAIRRIAPARIRSFFLTHGISVTTYEQGLLRLSMPDQPWRRGQLDLLTWTLASYVPHRSSIDRSKEFVVA
jgi:selenocysteine lyase/cysteine desulfurase